MSHLRGIVNLLYDLFNLIMRDIFECTLHMKDIHDLLMCRNEEQQASVMKALDKINRKYGKPQCILWSRSNELQPKDDAPYKSPHYRAAMDATFPDDRSLNHV
jgi:hypothetical protein